MQFLSFSARLKPSSTFKVSTYNNRQRRTILLGGYWAMVVATEHLRLTPQDYFEWEAQQDLRYEYFGLPGSITLPA